MKATRVFAVLFASCLLFTTIVNCSEEDEAEGDDDEETDHDSDDYPEEDDVVVLTKDKFDAAISSADTVLVEFYAPWCGHCKQLAPEYASAAKELKTADPPVILAKVDATIEKDLAERFQVQGFPTMKFFKKGEVYDYDGPRDSSGIISYMKERADPNWKPPPEAVVTLTKENFHDFVNEHELSLVEFYAPWCGHCKKLAPYYEMAAKDLKKIEKPIPLAKVDATQEMELAQEFDIKGYPTLKIFRKGRVTEYKGGRDAYGLIEHMKMQQGEASKLKATLKELRSYMKQDDVTVVAFFDEGDERLKIYMDAANELRERFRFGHSSSKEARHYYKIMPDSIVVFNAERFYTKYEPKLHVFNKKEFKSADVQKFIEDHAVPLVGHFTDDSEKYHYKQRRPLCLVFYTVDWSFDHRDATQLWRRKIAQVANDYKDITFAIIDESENEELYKEFGLLDSPEELNIGCYDKNNKRYKMEPMEEFEPDDIKEFLDKFKAGLLKPVLKSQPIPKKQGAVTTVVADSFQSIVMDETKDVLIEFYSPQCGHCKKLEPIYEKLAKKLKDEKNLVIAKIDVTGNEIVGSQFNIQGYPTIYFAPSNDKENPVKYEGEREVDNFEEFLKEHATVSFGQALREEL